MQESQPAASGASQPKKTVTIRYGVSERQVPAGMTADQIRDKFGPIFGIPKEAQAYSGNTLLDGGAVIDGNAEEGEQVIEFVRKSGEKG